MQNEQSYLGKKVGRRTRGSSLERVSVANEVEARLPRGAAPREGQLRAEEDPECRKLAAECATPAEMSEGELAGRCRAIGR